MKETVPQAQIDLMQKDPTFALEVLMPGMDLPPHQVAMLRGIWDATYSYASCGRSTGKTALTGIFNLLWCATHPNTQVLTLGLKFKTGQLMFEFMERMLNKYKELAKCIELSYAGDFALHGSSEWKISFKNGSVIKTIPSDINKAGARVRGYRATILEIDEIAAIPSEIVRQVFMPCASITDDVGNRKVVKLTTGGYRPSPAWDDCQLHYREFAKGNKEYYFANYCYKDVPKKYRHIIDFDAIKNLEEGSTAEEIARELYGNWTEFGGNYYSAGMLERNRLQAIELSAYQEEVGDGVSTYVIGVDPAFSGSDDTSMAVLKRISKRKWVTVSSVAINFKGGWAENNARLLYDYILRFNPMYIGVDKNGGEQLLHELKGFYTYTPGLLPISMEAESFENGMRMVRVFVPSGSGKDSNTRLNTRLLRALDGNGTPELLIPGSVRNDQDDLTQLDKLTNQLINVQATPIESQTGLFKFSSTQKKDRFSSLLYAWNAAEELIEVDEEAYGHTVGSSYVGDCIAIRIR